MSSCTIINAHITDQVLQLSNLPRIASGSKDALQIRCNFCGKWDGCSNAAVFYRTEDEVYHVLVEDGLVTVPWEVLADEGYFWMGFMGVDDLTRTTEAIRIEVAKGAITVATAVSDPTPDIYQQLLARMNNLIAVRPVGQASAYSIDGYFVRGTIKTNGVAAVLDVVINGVHDMPGGGLDYFSDYCIPPELMPMTTVNLVDQNDDGLLVAWINPTDVDAGGYGRITLSRIEEGGEIPTEAPFGARYDLARLAVPEVQDARVDHKGTTYDSAGDAVRAIGARMETLATTFQKQIRDNSTNITELEVRVKALEASGGATISTYDGEIVVDSSSNLISFTLAGTEYQAEEGMTWAEWCESNYNPYPIGIYVSGNTVLYNGSNNISGVIPTDTIIDGETYSLESMGSSN